MRAFLWPSNTPDLPTYLEPNDLKQLPYCRQVVFDRDTLGAQGVVKMSGFMSHRKLFPQVNPYDEEWKNLVGSNPNKRWYWHVFFDTSSVAENIIILFDVAMTFYNKFYEKKGVNES